MSEGLILIFVLYIIYLIMKKPKTTIEKPVPQAKAAQPTTIVATKATPKKPRPDQKSAKKTQAVASPTGCGDARNSYAGTRGFDCGKHLALLGRKWRYLCCKIG